LARMGKGWTFQTLIDDKMAVTAHCHHAPCNHSQKLDLVKLSDRFGREAPAMADDLIPKLKCAKCGSKRVGLIYTPDTSPNAYGKAKDGDDRSGPALASGGGQQIPGLAGGLRRRCRLTAIYAPANIAGTQPNGRRTQPKGGVAHKRAANGAENIVP